MDADWYFYDRVCRSVCPLAYLRNHTAELYRCFYTLPVAVAASSSRGVAICYVLPVFWITSLFHIIGRTVRHVYSRWRYESVAASISSNILFNNKTCTLCSSWAAVYRWRSVVSMIAFVWDGEQNGGWWADVSWCDAMISSTASN